MMVLQIGMVSISEISKFIARYESDEAAFLASLAGFWLRVGVSV